MNDLGPNTWHCRSYDRPRCHSRIVLGQLLGQLVDYRSLVTVHTLIMELAYIRTRHYGTWYLLWWDLLVVIVVLLVPGTCMWYSHNQYGLPGYQVPGTWYH